MSQKQYEIIPSHEDEKVWHIRITEGDFVETVIEYEAIGLLEEEEGMSFSFKVVSSPIEELTADDENLQGVAGSILLDILDEELK